MGPGRVLPFARVALRRRGARPVWMAGALLLALVTVKLFLVGLAGSGTVARIVSLHRRGGHDARHRLSGAAGRGGDRQSIPDDATTRRQ